MATDPITRAASADAVSAAPTKAELLRAKSERLARARRRLLGDADAEPIRKSEPKIDPLVRSTSTAFADFCEKAVALDVHAPANVDLWKNEVALFESEDDKHTHRLELLERLYRGCRVRIVHHTEKLNGCEGIVHPTKHAVGAERKLSVRCTMPDGAAQELTLRIDHLQLVQGRKGAEEEEAERVAIENAEAAEELQRRLTSQEPHVLLHELNAELRTKSFVELRKMAEQIDEGAELLWNPLLQYDKSAFRQALADLLIRSDDGGVVLNELIEGALTAEDTRAQNEMANVLGAQVEALEDEEAEDEEDEEDALEGAERMMGPSLPPWATSMQLMPQVAEEEGGDEDDDNEDVVIGPAMRHLLDEAPSYSEVVEEAPAAASNNFVGPLELAQQAGSEIPGSSVQEDDDEEVYGPAVPYAPPLMPAVEETQETANELAAVLDAAMQPLHGRSATSMATSSVASGEDEEGVVLW